MKKLVFFIMIAMCGTAIPAYAKEGSNFDGAKFGVVVGYDKPKIKMYNDFGSKSGALYGVTVGYDHDFRHLLLGVEGEFSDSSTKDTIHDLVTVGDDFSLRAGRDMYVGARIGVPVSSNILLYAKAGYTNARFTARYDDTQSAGSSKDSLDGYRIGGGAELGTTGGAFARLEYRYSDYGNYKYNGFDTGVKGSRRQVVVAAGYRF